MKLKSIFAKIDSAYKTAGRKINVTFKAPTNEQVSVLMLVAGIVLLNLGVVEFAAAVDDTLVTFAVADGAFLGIICAITRFIEGPFGALIMVIAGIGAIVSSAFGQYRAAIGLLVVAIGAFILRSLVATFFGARIYRGCEVGGGPV